MNMDYSKAFELLNQDTEKEERNKKAEKAVHDNLYNKGFRDGTVVLDKVRAEIIELTKCPYGTECLGANCPSNTDCMICGDHVLEIIDKYRTESEDKE